MPDASDTLRAYHAGSDGDQQELDREARDHARKVMERVLRHVPRVRRLVPIFEHDIAFAASGMDDMGIRPGGAHGDKTQSRGVRMATDRALTTMKRRLEQIDAIYKASLNLEQQHFVDVAYWSGSVLRPVNAARMLYISESTFYDWRIIILDAFIDGLSDRGWVAELDWWGGITLQDLEGFHV